MVKNIKRGIEMEKIWLSYDINGIGGIAYKCTNCKKRSDNATKYCPNCGEKKDLDKNNRPIIERL
jgi:rRNA maturation endonuclease Nob1